MHNESGRSDPEAATPHAKVFAIDRGDVLLPWSLLDPLHECPFGRALEDGIGELDLNREKLSLLLTHLGLLAV